MSNKKESLGQQLKILIEQGCTKKEAAAMMGRSIKQIERIQQSNGLKFSGSRLAWTDKEKKDAQFYALAGFTISDAAAAMGKTYAQMVTYAARASVPFKKQQRGAKRGAKEVVIPPYAKWETLLNKCFGQVNV